MAAFDKSKIKNRFFLFVCFGKEVVIYIPHKGSEDKSLYGWWNFREEGSPTQQGDTGNVPQCLVGQKTGQDCLAIQQQPASIKRSLGECHVETDLAVVNT